MQIPWLKSHADRWSLQCSQDRMPHAVLVSGTRGLGKRALAAWFAATRLGLPVDGGGPRHPYAVPEHPDLHWVAPLADKQTLGIEQIRALVAELSLTSHAGSGKVAVLEPANAMTRNAANSLLKTLEEPPGDTLMVLVVDRLGSLPATIVSRCQRIHVTPPSVAASESWLQAIASEADWPALLQLAGRAPLAALDAQEDLEQARTMAGELAAVAQGRSSPLKVAERWAKLDLPFVLDWLTRTVQQLIRRSLHVSELAAQATPLDSVLRRVDSRGLFCYLDTIVRLRNQAAGSYHPQLALESLLIDWAGGLRQRPRALRPGECLPGTAADE